MVYLNLTRIVSVVVIIIGLVVMIGWFTDDDTLKRLNPDWVTMKFSTATSFFVSGMVIFLINESRNKNSEVAKIIIFAPLIVVLFFMAMLLISTITGTSTGVSSLFVKEDASTVLHSVKAGTPSVGTMINFILIIGAGFTYLIVHPKHRKYLSISGGIILALAIVALIGYSIDSPALYYQVEEVSGAMALHTAIAFALLGVSLILLAKLEYVERGVSKKSHSMKISTKLIFAFLISALFPIIIIGFVSFDLAQTSLEKTVFIAVNEQADLQVDRIEAFFFERKADAVVTSELDLFKREIPTLNQFFTDPSSSQYLETDRLVDTRLKIIREAYGYDNIMLTNTEGIIIFVSKDASKPTYLGKSFLNIDPDTFYEGKKGVFISKLIDDVGGDGKPELYTSSPILDDKKNLLGVLIFDNPIQQFLDNLLQKSYIGDTSESLVGQRIGDYAVFLNSLRFDPDAAFKRKIHLQDDIGQPIRESVQGIEGSDYSIDYRSEPIIAAWRYIPSLDMGLVSKVDVAEAFAPIEQLQRDITVLAIVFMIGTGFFGVSASRTISNPLIKLKDLAIKISEGDLDSRVLVQSTDEIGQLSEMMNETAEKLKQVAKQKDEFASMITHELKTPLVPIQGYCANLKNPKMGKLNERQKQAVDEIYNNSVELLNLIQNILNAQKIELHQLKFSIKNISLDEYMKERHIALLSIMEDKNIQFKNSTEKELSVKVDPSKLNEIITNLVINAIDFVPDENGIIEIGAKEHEKQILFYIKDNGVGIPEDKIKNLFKKFYQADTSLTRKHGGSGLGLSICKGYVEGMGGKIWVESKPNVETVFYFTLPKSD